MRLGSHGAEHVNALYDDLVRIPGVLEAIHVAGADDFHLHVAVDSPEALRDLVLQHITVHRVVRQTETQLIFETRRGVGVLGLAVRLARLASMRAELALAVLGRVPALPAGAVSPRSCSTRSVIASIISVGRRGERLAATRACPPTATGRAARR